MRFLYSKLSGYIGIYNGLGLNELEIDFSKSKNNITVISGPNGCGKTTLLNALNVLPDTNDCFVPSMIASKQLRIYDDGVIYDIFINHPLDNHGNRATTKASIMKNGIELNPNGNVSSYKDIIFNEFDLDSNYITLSHLSGNDRGLADKRPGERKKFVANISSSLDVYNDMYKNLNKKSNVYKNYISSLSSKIGNIGDESYLRSTLLSLNSRFNNIKNEIETLKTSVIENKTIISMNDPNGIMQQRYQEIEQQFNQLEKEVDKAFLFLTDFYKDNFENDRVENNKESIEKAQKEVQQIIEKNKSDLESLNSQRILLINTIQNLNENINRDQIRISNLEKEINTELDNQLNSAKLQLLEIENEFSKFGFGDIKNVSIDEIRSIIKILNDIISGIDRIYEMTSFDTLEEICNYSKGSSYDIAIRTRSESIPKLRSEINNTIDERTQLCSYLKDLSIMDSRPKNCKIDSCPFLEKGYNVLKTVKSKQNLEKDIEIVNAKLKDQNQKLAQLEFEIDNLNKYKSAIDIINRLASEIEINYDILIKTDLAKEIINIDIFLDHIAHGYKFNDIRNTNSLLNIINDITRYKSLTQIKQNLESEFKSNQNNINLFNEYKSDIEKNQELVKTNNKKLED